MSANALLKFYDTPDESNGESDTIVYVYQDLDGYPEGVLEALKRATPYSWKLPRWEARDFGAAFVAGNKQRSTFYQGYGIHLSDGRNYYDYLYEITFRDGNIQVTCKDDESQILFEGTLEEFYKKMEEE